MPNFNDKPTTFPSLLTAFLLLRRVKAKSMRALPILNSGLTEQGIPFIELDNGRKFYSYLPSQKQRVYYRLFVDKNTKRKLAEDCINVAFDILLRYSYGGKRIIQGIPGKYDSIEEGNTILEIGAYIGCYAMRAAEIVGERGKVIAIEAIPENFHLLKLNMEENSFDNVLMVQKAAWNSQCQITFQRHSRQMASAIPNVVKPLYELKVDADTVDHVLEELNISKVDLVRIQVNGAEQETLEGMSKILEQSPKLLIAAKYKKNNEPSWKRVVAFLESRGYTVQRCKGKVFAEKITRTL